MNEVEELTFRDRHCFSLMIVFAILMVILLVSVSMTLYYRSGAAQLDLSRPGYKSIRTQVDNYGSDFNNFAATGDINQTVITQFKEFYSEQAQKIKAANAFSGDPLDPSALDLTVSD